MADKRMFTMKICDSDAFLDMPLSTQCLYFHLNMRADDDGFIGNPKRVQKTVGASEDDLKLLIAKRFLLTFDDGVIVIKHWRMHNTIQSDRYKPTAYQDELKSLSIKENKAYTFNADSTGNDMETKCFQNVSAVLGLGLDSGLEIDSELDRKSGRFAPPTLDDVMSYAKERKREDLAQAFYDYYSAGDWKDAKGQKVKNWKQKFITWSNHNNVTTRNSRHRVEMVSDYSNQPKVELTQEEADAIKASFRNMK